MSVPREGQDNNLVMYIVCYLLNISVRLMHLPSGPDICFPSIVVKLHCVISRMILVARGDFHISFSLNKSFLKIVAKLSIAI